MNDNKYLYNIIYKEINSLKISKLTEEMIEYIYKQILENKDYRTIIKQFNIKYDCILDLDSFLITIMFIKNLILNSNNYSTLDKVYHIHLLYYLDNIGLFNAITFKVRSDALHTYYSYILDTFPEAKLPYTTWLVAATTIQPCTIPPSRPRVTFVKPLDSYHSSFESFSIVPSLFSFLLCVLLSGCFLYYPFRYYYYHKVKAFITFWRS